MRTRILNCLHREAIVTETALVAALRKDALTLPPNWMSIRLAKALAWVVNNPLRVHHQVKTLTKQGLLMTCEHRIVLTDKGLAQVDLPPIAVSLSYTGKAGQPTHLRLAHPA